MFNPLKKAKQRHIALERTCLAFNLAVCELIAASFLVSNVLGGNSDASLLVEACRQYQIAAGHFSVLCNSPPDGSLTLDLGLEALNVFQAAALASAQTCMCEYAQRTGKMDSNIAVLCAGASNTWSQVVQRSRVKLLSGDGTYKQIGDCAQYLSVFYEREAEIRMSHVNSEKDEKGLCFMRNFFLVSLFSFPFRRANCEAEQSLEFITVAKETFEDAHTMCMFSWHFDLKESSRTSCIATCVLFEDRRKRKQ